MRRSIIIVKELEENEGYEEMDKLAQTILDTLGLEKREYYTYCIRNYRKRAEGSFPFLQRKPEWLLM